MPRYILYCDICKQNFKSYLECRCYVQEMIDNMDLLARSEIIQRYRLKNEKLDLDEMIYHTSEGYFRCEFVGNRMFRFSKISQEDYLRLIR